MIQKIVNSETSPAIPLPVNVIPTPCSDQPSHSQEQSTKRVALDDLRCVHTGTYRGKITAHRQRSVLL